MEDNKFLLLNDSSSVPTVTLLNDPYYEIEVLDGNTITLVMRPRWSSEFEITSAHFQITELETGMVGWVGGDQFDETDFGNDSTVLRDYNIYRGGEFEILAAVTFRNKTTQEQIEMCSESTTVKVNYPVHDEIKNLMKDRFKATWELSKTDPARREYGYFV